MVVDEVYESLSERDAPVKLMHRIKRGDPYKALITAMLSPRVKDSITYKVANELFEKAPTPEKLMNMEVSEIEEVIKPLGFYRQKAINIKLAAEKIVKEYNGNVPDSVEELLKFRGVGRKIANLVVSVAFEKPSIAVDTHVYRILKDRWRFIPNATSVIEVEKFLKENVPECMWSKINRILVAFGQAICKPTKPLCDRCPLSHKCPYNSSKGKRVGKKG